MTVEIRAVRPDELSAWMDTIGMAFLERVDTTAAAAQVGELWDLQRAWAAIEDGTIVGTTRTWATELTVPGLARLAASAVAAVSVRPTHRRRGIMRRLMDAEHDAARERGEAVSILYAAEYPIYGRLGYGPASPIVTWTLDVRSATFHRPATGRVEFVAPADAVADMRRIHEAWRLRQPGEIRRRDYFWDIDLGLRPSPWGEAWKGFVAVHRDAAGIADGYVRYSAKGEWARGRPAGEITVDDLHALTDEAYDALWQFLAAIDWAATVKAGQRRPVERLPWLLTDGRAAQASDYFDGLWVKLHDLPGALAARAYERAGTLAVEAIDEPGTDRERRTRVLLDASPDGTTCKPTTRGPDVTIASDALGAAFLGGTPLRSAVLAAGADEHRTGALAELDALLRTLDPPWCSTFF